LSNPYTLNYIIYTLIQNLNTTKHRLLRRIIRSVPRRRVEQGLIPRVQIRRSPQKGRQPKRKLHPPPLSRNPYVVHEL